jgi:methyl-accepting chemotaxis protein
MQLSPDATFRIIDQKGTILVRNPDLEKWIGRSFLEAGIIKTQLSQHEGTTETEGVDGIRRFFAFAPVHSGTVETGLFVSNGISASIALAQVNNILFRDLTGLSIAIFLMLVIVWFVGDAFILSHVNTLIKATERLGRGDLSVRTSLTYDKGEVGELARAFDGMVGSLQEKDSTSSLWGRELRMIELKKKIKELEKKIEELNNKVISPENTKGNLK